MAAEDKSRNAVDTSAELARIVYDQMDMEPRRMNVAIELAKEHLADINRVLVERGLRSEHPDSTRVEDQ